jgi:hypothetical protein
VATKIARGDLHLRADDPRDCSDAVHDRA